jgi:uncharacterized protein
MKRIFAGVMLAFGLAALCCQAAVAQEFPQPQGYVNDFAGIMTLADRNSLEAALIALEQETGAEVVVVTVADMSGTYIEDYAVQLFEAWGIGKQKQDNGVLFITAVAEHAVRIEVGYGLEAIITDGRAGRILDEKVLPSFREGNYSNGIVQGTKAIEEYVRSGTPPSAIKDNPIRKIFGDYSTLMTIAGVVTIYLVGFMARTKDVWLGTIWGIIIGVLLGLMAGNLVATILLPAVSAGIGALLDLILSRNYKARSSAGMSTGWWSSGGGFRGGGRGSSFGGFGGGHSGGSGASRGW